MRVALITSEFSGLPGSGGIGTYFLELARCLACSGVVVEVFTVGEPGCLGHESGVLFHHLGNLPRGHFPVHAAEAFADRHREQPFDVLECAETNAEGALAARAVPEVANVVRMHSPSKLLNRYLDMPASFLQRIRRVLKDLRIAFGAWRRALPILPLQLDSDIPPWFPSHEVEERNAAAKADLVIVMSEEMRAFVKGYWWISDESIATTPNPLNLDGFSKSISETLHPKKGGDSTHRIGFIGRLEPRKGLIQFADALRRVLHKHPDWSVVIAGRATSSCITGIRVDAIAKEKLKEFGSRVEFIGPVSPSQIPAFLDDLDICVFPSLWDNFPYVVLEAMAAGKAIIATSVGAVPDMLDHGKAGLIAAPGNVAELASSLERAMKDPSLVRELGDTAQKRAMELYHPTLVTRSILESYQVAMQRRDQRIKSLQNGGNEDRSGESD